MVVNWKGRVAIWDLSWRCRGEFQPIDVKSTCRSTSSPWPPSIGQEKGELSCGGHPHIPRQGRPCNAFLAFADDTSSPVADFHWCDVTLIGSRYPLNLNTYVGASRGPNWKWGPFGHWRLLNVE